MLITKANFKPIDEPEMTVACEKGSARLMGDGGDPNIVDRDRLAFSSKLVLETGIQMARFLPNISNRNHTT